MNDRLKKLPDGSGATGKPVWFDIAREPGGHHFRDYGEIYWPFALHWKTGEVEGWHITHLPSGYRATTRGPLRKAQAKRLIRRLRELGIDWSFRLPTDRAFPQEARKKAGALVRRYKPLTVSVLP